MPSISSYCLGNTRYFSSELSKYMKCYALGIQLNFYMITMYTMSTFTILFSFIETFCSVNFPHLTTTRTSTLGANLPLESQSMNLQGVKTINLWLILAKQANQKSDINVKFITLHYFSYIHIYNKQLLDEVFVISRIIKVEVMVIS